MGYSVKDQNVKIPKVKKSKKCECHNLISKSKLKKIPILISIFQTNVERQNYKKSPLNRTIVMKMKSCKVGYEYRIGAK